MHVRAGTESDSRDIGRIQAVSPEAAQWDLAGYPVLIAMLDGLTAGFLAWRETAPDEAEILNLAVHPSFRRRGVGLALVAAVPRPVVFLEARESNHAARALYRKAGFTESGVRLGYYSAVHESHPESAIVMRLKR
jgi:ribosomal protein S18 acetylase RimI-like enzyme